MSIAAVIATHLIAGLIGAAIARAKSAGIVDILIQEHPKRHWHYRASIKGHEVIPRRKGGHTSAAVARACCEAHLEGGQRKGYELQRGATRARAEVAQE